MDGGLGLNVGIDTVCWEPLDGSVGDTVVNLAPVAATVPTTAGDTTRLPGTGECPIAVRHRSPIAITRTHTARWHRQSAPAEGGEYRWRLRHRNGNVLADGREGYSSRSGAWRGIESVKRHAPNAGLDDEQQPTPDSASAGHQ